MLKHDNVHALIDLLKTLSTWGQIFPNKNPTEMYANKQSADVIRTSL
jgi:hypothetical protein